MILWLVGMMGVGKTSAGRRAAKSLGVAFSDTDEKVEQDAGLSIETIWDQGGEDLFRELECQVVLELAASTGHVVVATGGGAVLSAENRAAMKDSGKVVWLSTEEANLVERLKASSGRPLLRAPNSVGSRIAELFLERESIYEGLADVSIEVTKIDEVQTAKEVEALWNRFQSA